MVKPKQYRQKSTTHFTLHCFHEVFMMCNFQFKTQYICKTSDTFLISSDSEDTWWYKNDQMKYATVSHFRLNLKQCKTSSPSSSHSTTVYYYTLAPNIYQVFTLIMSEKRSRCHHITPREIFLSGYELFCQATHSFFQQSHEKKKRG